MKKVILGTLGVIALGSLGSGFWELALKPALIWITEPMLYLATLGLNSLRDDMYASVAKGSYDRAGLVLVGGFAGFVLSAASLLLFSVTLRRLRDRRRGEGSDSLAESPPPADRPAGFFRSRWTAPMMMALVVTVLVFFVVVFRLAYEEEAATYATQLQRIIAPYVSPEERLTFESRFAQVSSRADYLALVTDLREIASRNGAKVPAFDVY